MAIRNEYDAHRALAETPRGLSCTRWRERGEFTFERSVDWRYWLALSLTCLLAVAVAL